MKKLLSAALIAAVAVPTAAILPGTASAQSRHDRYDRDRHHDRDGRYDRRGHHRDHRDYRDDRFDRGHRWGHNDWERYRRGNRTVFARGNWRAPFRYTSFRPGVRISASYFGTRYRISNPWRYHLPPAPGGYIWVRHYNDVLLVNARRGTVVRVHRNFFW